MSVASAIISYIKTTKFPDNIRTDLYSKIYYGLVSWKQDKIIAKLSSAEIKKTGYNYFALHILSKLLIKRKCMDIIRIFIKKDIFILPGIYSQKYGILIELLEIIASERPHEKLELKYLHYINNYNICLFALDIYTKQYTLEGISNYPQNEIMRQAISKYKSWASFDGSLRAEWIKSAIIRETTN